jgi:ribosomal protein S27AE
VIPPPSLATAASPPTEDVSRSLPMAKQPKPRQASHRCGYIPWQRLMRQLGIDVETCPRCGGKMKVIALVRDAQGIARYLRHLGLPTEEPSMAPARGPPFWQSRVLRRRYGEPLDAAQA